MSATNARTVIGGTAPSVSRSLSSASSYVSSDDSSAFGYQLHRLRYKAMECREQLLQKEGIDVFATEAIHFASGGPPADLSVFVTALETFGALSTFYLDSLTSRSFIDQRVNASGRAGTLCAASLRLLASLPRTPALEPLRYQATYLFARAALDRGHTQQAIDITSHYISEEGHLKEMPSSLSFEAITSSTSSSSSSSASLASSSALSTSATTSASAAAPSSSTSLSPHVAPVNSILALLDAARAEHARLETFLVRSDKKDLEEFRAHGLDARATVLNRIVGEKYGSKSIGYYLRLMGEPFPGRASSPTAAVHPVLSLVGAKGGSNSAAAASATSIVETAHASTKPSAVGSEAMAGASEGDLAAAAEEEESEESFKEEEEEEEEKGDSGAVSLSYMRKPVSAIGRMLGRLNLRDLRNELSYRATSVVRIGSWNIRASLPIHEVGANLKKKINTLVEFTREHSWGIVAIQEAPGPDLERSSSSLIKFPVGDLLSSTVAAEFGPEWGWKEVSLRYPGGSFFNKRPPLSTRKKQTAAVVASSAAVAVAPSTTAASKKRGASAAATPATAAAASSSVTKKASAGKKASTAKAKTSVVESSAVAISEGEDSDPSSAHHAKSNESSIPPLLDGAATSLSAALPLVEGRRSARKKAVTTSDSEGGGGSPQKAAAAATTTRRKKNATTSEAPSDASKSTHASSVEITPELSSHSAAAMISADAAFPSTLTVAASLATASPHPQSTSTNIAAAAASLLSSHGECATPPPSTRSVNVTSGGRARDADDISSEAEAVRVSAALVPLVQRLLQGEGGELSIASQVVSFIKSFGSATGSAVASNSASLHPSSSSSLAAKAEQSPLEAVTTSLASLALVTSSNSSSSADAGVVPSSAFATPPRRNSHPAHPTSSLLETGTTLPLSAVPRMTHTSSANASAASKPHKVTEVFGFAYDKKKWECIATELIVKKKEEEGGGFWGSVEGFFRPPALGIFVKKVTGKPSVVAAATPNLVCVVSCHLRALNPSRGNTLDLIQKDARLLGDAVTPLLQDAIRRAWSNYSALSASSTAEAAANSSSSSSSSSSVPLPPPVICQTIILGDFNLAYPGSADDEKTHPGIPSCWDPLLAQGFNPLLYNLPTNIHELGNSPSSTAHCYDNAWVRVESGEGFVGGQRDVSYGSTIPLPDLEDYLEEFGGVYDGAYGAATSERMRGFLKKQFQLTFKDLLLGHYSDHRPLMIALKLAKA